MNWELIEEFSEIANEDINVYHYFKTKDELYKWNCICSAMDWIKISISYLKEDHFEEKNNVSYGIKLFTYISCIDMAWEGIIQLHRVLIDEDTIPFKDEKTIFNIDAFNIPDNDCFKEIKACFGSHSVNLNIKRSKKEKEKRYASWSFGTDIDTATVILYPKYEEQDNIYLTIKLKELQDFFESRYTYLEILIEKLSNKIEELRKQYYEKYRSEIIEKKSSPLEQLEILEKEDKKRTNNQRHNGTILQIKHFLETEFRKNENSELVNEFRNRLLFGIDEIYENMQNMIFNRLEVQKYLSPITSETCQDNILLLYYSNLQDYISYLNEDINTYPNRVCYWNEYKCKQFPHESKYIIDCIKFDININFDFQDINEFYWLVIIGLNVKQGNILIKKTPLTGVSFKIKY